MNRRCVLDISAALAAAPLGAGSTTGRYFENCDAIEAPDGHLRDTTIAGRSRLEPEEPTRDYLAEHERPKRGGMEKGLRRTGKGGA